jgi:hypothetical protein
VRTHPASELADITEPQHIKPSALPVAGAVIALILATAGCSPTTSDGADTAIEPSISSAPTAIASLGQYCTGQLELNATTGKAAVFGDTSCDDADAIAAAVVNAPVDDASRVITVAGRSWNYAIMESTQSIYGCTDVANADNRIDWLRFP